MCKTTVVDLGGSPVPRYRPNVFRIMVSVRKILQNHRLAPPDDWHRVLYLPLNNHVFALSEKKEIDKINEKNSYCSGTLNLLTDQIL